MRAVVCLTTVSNRKEGERIARHLVKKRLAACVNLLPGVVSYFHWKKKICREGEMILLIKTIPDKVAPLERELSKIHPYDLPEWIVLPVVRGMRRYLEWLETSVA